MPITLNMKSVKHAEAKLPGSSVVPQQSSMDAMDSTTQIISHTEGINHSLLNWRTYMARWELILFLMVYLGTAVFFRQASPFLSDPHTSIGWKPRHKAPNRNQRQTGSRIYTAHQSVVNR